jgi:hypothetical protein
MKNLILFICLLNLYAHGITSAQAGTIRGKVFTIGTYEPYPFAAIVIEGTNIISFSDFDGNFLFTGIAPGLVRLSASSAGFETFITDELRVSNKNFIFVEIGLKESEIELEISDFSPKSISPFQGKELQKTESFLVFSTSVNPTGASVEVVFEKGESFNHPIMVVWVEDLEGNYQETLYVSKSIATGVFRHGLPSKGRWLPGPLRRPAALPYWGHKRGVKAEDGLFLPSPNSPMLDAISGATPKTSFRLQTQSPQSGSKKFRVMFEINQSWDWNDFWTNNKFPGDKCYITSAQPALVYMATIDLDSAKKIFELKVIGHSHWSGATGELFTDTSTLTTALEIAKSIVVRIP